MALLNEFTADTDISLVDALVLQKHTLVVKKGNKKLYEGKLTKFLYAWMLLWRKFIVFFDSEGRVMNKLEAVEDD